MRLVIDLQGAQGTSHARGIGRYSRELARAMAREARGHEVIVALSGAFPEQAEELAASFQESASSVSIRMWYPPRGTAALMGTPSRAFAETLRAQFLASLHPDLVHVSSMYEGLGDDVISLQPRHLQRLPVVATCYDLIPLIRHDEYFDALTPLAPGVNWYYQCVQEMAQCEGLLAISDSSRNEAIRYLPFPPERVFNIQAGISADFRPANLSAAERLGLLQRYGLRDGFILFLGAGDIRKNEAGLITAYARLPPELRERHQLAIVGKMDPAGLRATAAQLGIDAGNFAIVPFVREEDLNGLYSSCALFVFPSLHEGFGLPLGEAMACGAPAVASNTSSLPEVIGRADATFDPTDPDAIAACMRKVLENPRLREELAAYGPVQAGQFTWQRSAARAWDALEEIDEHRTTAATPRIAAPLGRRQRMAFVSPLPPQSSGIADYSAELVPALARHYDITLVSDEAAADPRLAAAFPHVSIRAFPAEASRFDRVLYQIGNSSFHRSQIEDLLPQCPGVVVLHDAFLSDYKNWLAHEEGRPDEFRATLLHAHGYPALRWDAEHGREPSVQRFPCSLGVLQRAIGVIQHSRHGRAILESHYGAGATRNISVIPHLRADRPRPERAAARRALAISEDTFVVCSFGAVTPQKSPFIVSEAWRLSGLTGLMVFVGDAAPDWQSRLDDGDAGIRATGRLTRAQYDRWMAAADLTVQWRTGSRGESSGAVADALVAGVPVILNRDGSSAELPPDVACALPADADAWSLAGALVALREDLPRRAALSTAARAYALRELAPHVVAEQYAESIEAAYARHEPTVMARHVREEAQAMATQQNGLMIAARAVTQSFPSRLRGGGHPRLLVDISELARRDPGSGIQRVVREVGRRALETPPDGWRGEAVRFQDGRLRQTFAKPLSMLGLEPLALADMAMDAGRGDVMLCMDVNPELTDAEYAELQRLRLDGLRVILLVHDLLPWRHPDLFPASLAALVAGWYSRMLRISDGVVCTSQVGVDDLTAWLDEGREHRRAPLPIGYVHLGGDFRVESTAHSVSPEVQAALDSAAQHPTVVMAGTVEPRKGYAQVLAAFEMLWATGADLNLIIVGKLGWQMDDFATRLRTAVSSSGNRLHWFLHSTDYELRALYRAGSGLLMASNHEGFGLPVVEAAHLGLAVMVRDLPVFRELVGEHGTYFSGDTPEVLAQALRIWAESGFSPSNIALRPPTWDDTYRQIAAMALENRWGSIWQPKLRMSDHCCGRLQHDHGAGPQTPKDRAHDAPGQPTFDTGPPRASRLMTAAAHSPAATAEREGQGYVPAQHRHGERLQTAMSTTTLATHPDKRPMDQNRDQLRAKINSLKWHHQIDFGDGLMSPGNGKIDVMKAQADVYFRIGLSGKTFLDIGCWDGYNSIEAHRRGAKRVLATDHFAWSDQCWGTREAFELARTNLAPSIEVMDIDLPDLTPARIGTFDIVLFAGVFYHLRHPFLALENLSKLATETFIIETHLDAVGQDRPMMVFYPGKELAGDETNWWGPNRPCIEAMLRDVGFPIIEYQDHPMIPNRGIFHGYRR